jgi:hypothetical protein
MFRHFLFPSNISWECPDDTFLLFLSIFKIIVENVPIQTFYFNFTVLVKLVVISINFEVWNCRLFSNWAASQQNHPSRLITDQDPCCSLTNSFTSRETDGEQHGSWSDCTDAQAGLDPGWSLGFVMTRLNCIIFLVYCRF